MAVSRHTNADFPQSRHDPISHPIAASDKADIMNLGQLGHRMKDLGIARLWEIQRGTTFLLVPLYPFRCRGERQIEAWDQPVCAPPFALDLTSPILVALVHRAVH